MGQICLLGSFVMYIVSSRASTSSALVLVTKKEYQGRIGRDTVSMGFSSPEDYSVFLRRARRTPSLSTKSYLRMIL